MIEASENLFSYGTLQLESVQRDLYGRLLSGVKDAIIGWKLDWVEITDEKVLASSDQTRHPVVKHTGDNADLIAGTVFQITSEELAQSDAYEVDDYKRAAVTTLSGKTVWVYVAAES